MKKLLILVALFTTISITKAEAQQQGSGDPAAMMQRMKDRLKPQLIEKAKLTDAQADKVIEIHFNARQQMHGFKDMNDEDKKKKMDEVQAAINKEYKSIPLSDDQIKAVGAFFDEQRKAMQQRQQNNGGGGNQ